MTPSRRRLPRALLARVARGVLCGVGLSLPTVALAALVSFRWGILIDADHDAVRAATDITRSHPHLQDVLRAWQAAFHPKIVYLAAVPVAVFTSVRGARGRTVWGVATMLVGWNLGLQAKLLVERARPIIADPVAHAPGYSFPSGHAYNTTLMITVCLIMVWPMLRNRAARTGLVALGAVLVILTGLDRIFLGVHFPSDVAAGVLLALAVALGSFAGYRHTPPHPPR